MIKFIFQKESWFYLQDLLKVMHDYDVEGKRDIWE